MPAISLVVCLYKERALLKRLLENAAGCYDDLVVIHDGVETGDSGNLAPPLGLDFSLLALTNPLPQGYRVPALPAKPDSLHELVLRHGGRFYEGPRAFQQEPHWPFAWQMAKHHWILRLDADEFPSEELTTWLKNFRHLPEPDSSISGYTCIWPLWDGKRAVTKSWPTGRLFLFNRDRIRFFGMVEQTPIPDADWIPLHFILHHEPIRKSYGIRNILFRKQAYNWRTVIAKSLIDSPNKLPCWRWNSADWPSSWSSIQDRPLHHSLRSLLKYPLYQLRDIIAARELPRLSACLQPGLHHFMLGIRIWMEKRRIKK